MALTPLLTFTSVTADGSQSTLTDATVYGGANPDRNEVAIYLTAYKVDEDQVESALTVETFDPETATTFTVTNTIDGRYKYKFVIVDYWLVGTVYNQYDMVWSPTENAFYQYIFATPSSGQLVTNTTYYSPVTDPTTIIDDDGTAEESGNLIFQILEKIIDYATAACYANIAILSAKENCADDCGCSSKLCKSKNRIRTLLSVMRISDTRQQYLQGERFAREAEKYCSDCGCLEQ